MEQQQQQQVLTFHEIAVLNTLNTLEPGERITFEKLAQYVGMNTRNCKRVVENLRTRGFRIVASRKPTDLGIRYALNDQDWIEYLEKRKKEIQNRLAALGKL